MGKSRGHQETANRAEELAYDEELLSANWNPVVELLAWTHSFVPEPVRRPAYEAIEEHEADTLLGRIYACGA